MSKLLATSETLELLEQFRSTIQEFAAREENLDRELRNLTDARSKRYEQQVRTAAEEAQAKLGSAKADLESDHQRIQGHFALRERRLHDAHSSALKTALERVDHEEGRRKYSVQKGTLDAERRRDENHAANNAALEQFRVRLAEARQDLEELEVITRKAFRGMPLFQRLLRREPDYNSADSNHEAMLEESIRLQEEARKEVVRFQALAAPKLVRAAPLWVWVALAVGLAFGLSPALHRFSYEISVQRSYAYAGAFLALALFIYFAAYSAGATLASSISLALLRARKLQTQADEAAEQFSKSEFARIEREAHERIHLLKSEWENAVREANEARSAWPPHLEQKWLRGREKNEHQRATRTEAAKAEHAARCELLRAAAEKSKSELEQAHGHHLQELRKKKLDSWNELVAVWHAKIDPLFATLKEATSTSASEFPAWDAAIWNSWTPPADFKNFAPFAKLELDLTKYAAAVPHDQQLALEQSRLAVPLLLNFPREGSVLFETSGPGKETVVAALNNIIFRLLATNPAGKLSFTLFDPISLGESFAPVTHLADYEENLINGRIWTQADQIEQRLADLNEHMEKVIQMYLRNEYETIAEYNRAAGNIAEKYHFLVIVDFPANFTEAALRRLLRIATSGARCGVYTLIHLDHRHPQAPAQLVDELRKSSIVIKYAGNQFVLAHPSANPGKVSLDAPPSPDVGNKFLEKAGDSSRGASRVEVPFAQIAPDPTQVWSLDNSEELRVPIGRSGASKLQQLALGRGTKQHVLVAGKTGSGKSTLFHVMITNLALWFSPTEVEFYLIDFKKGVEFKAYALHQLPHARVVAIESDREFALSVLQRVDEELRHRGELFRKLHVQDIAAYRKAAPGQPMPRTILIIDEFQEFFVEEDRIAQAAAMLLDRIVRQGRAFGIHVVLGSQTLGGAYTLARTTLGQMVIRIALQTNEADAYLIMDENNSAPRLLSRPGEGIYNDMAGATEGNSPFQTVWLPEKERSAALKQVHALALKTNNPFPPPVIFEGNAPAEVQENTILTNLISSGGIARNDTPKIWLGAPNSIKGPTEVAFHRRSGSNLLIVGQKEETVLSLFGIGLITLAAQLRGAQARFVLLESTTPGSPERAFLDRTAAAVPQGVQRDNVELLLAEIAQKLSAPDDTQRNEQIFIFIHNLQNFKKFRAEDEFSLDANTDSPAAQLKTIITEGAARGVHLIVSVDSYNSVTRFLGRKGLSEFEMRVLFQMSAADSASLVDDSKAASLGLYRALLYNEHEGRFETFRPYARPDGAWLEMAREKLQQPIS